MAKQSSFSIGGGAGGGAGVGAGVEGNVSSSSATASALSLLLSEDPLLGELRLTDYKTSSGHGDVVNEEAAFAYAAALMHDESPSWMSSTGDVQKRATEALSEVDRKLALVEGLAERVARDHPEDVAGPLLKLHGHDLSFLRTSGTTTSTSSDSEGQKHKDETQSGGSSLVVIRDKCDRLHRQGEMLENAAKRVETSLQRHLEKLEATTTRLSRVLQLSSTLKMAMRLRFEAKKIQGCGIDFAAILTTPTGKAASSAHDVDLRDLTRAAASVATMETLMTDPQLTNGGEPIHVVEQMRPEVETAALAVRRAAAGLLAEQQQGSGMSTSKLGATLQVYFHLNELPQATWSAVSQGLAAAEKAASMFFNPASLQRLREAAITDARIAADTPAGGGLDPSAASGAGRKKRHGDAVERITKKKLRERRAEAAERWARSVGDAALKVSTLHRVLARKSDPTSRRNFLDVVSSSSVPEKFQQAESYLKSQRDRQAASASGPSVMMASHMTHPSIFNLFWTQMCIALGARIQRLLKYDSGSVAEDVAALYPAVRAAALRVLGDLSDSTSTGFLGGGLSDSSVGGDESTLAGGGQNSSAGIMGGSSILDDALNAGWGSIDEADSGAGGDGDGRSEASFLAGAGSWTRDPLQGDLDDASGTGGARGSYVSSPALASASASSSSSAFSSEWRILQGENNVGLYPLQCAFLEVSSERLCAPLQHMFPEEAAVDEGGVAIPVLPALPSRYDLAKVEAAIKEELSIADPRQGGGEFGMTAMISENIVDMVKRFCAAAGGATSGAVDDSDSALTYLHSNDLTATEALVHDLKLAGVISALAAAVKSAPDNTFIAPYRPAQSAQHEEAARVCTVALQPAARSMENVVRKTILDPLSRALNERISGALAKMHQGTYLDDAEGDAAGFVQTNLATLYDGIASRHLEKLPSEYASIVASTVVTYSIYAFVSNASLVRPLGEKGRLRITQDLADFELSLEQLVLKAGNATRLDQVAGGKPYAELRAARQMLFWNGFEDKSLTAVNISDGLLSEVWIGDVRPSTILHFLFSFAPNLLSSPHHSKRMSPEAFVNTLVKFDGSVDDGEASAWLTTSACCDAYQQRETVGFGGSGDKRVASVLMTLAPELLRRRRH